MNSRSTVLICNPYAGRGRAERREREVEVFRRALVVGGIDTTVLRTKAGGDATRLAREAIGRGVREIIVAGGDGTINEALQAIVGVAGVRLGVWARGTANVLARELRLSSKPEQAAAVVAANNTRQVYVGCATEEETGARRYFFLMAGIGLDASVVRGVPAGLKRRAGEAAFWYSGLAHLALWRPVSFEVEAGGASYAATFASIGKAPRYGGNLSVTPGARLSAPEFQLCIVDSHSRLRYLRLLTRALASGVKEGRTDARLLSVARVRATGDALVQLDGELTGTLPMIFEVAPHPITIFVPDN